MLKHLKARLIVLVVWVGRTLTRTGTINLCDITALFGNKQTSKCEETEVAYCAVIMGLCESSLRGPPHSQALCAYDLLYGACP